MRIGRVVVDADDGRFAAAIEPLLLEAFQDELREFVLGELPLLGERLADLGEGLVLDVLDLVAGLEMALVALLSMSDSNCWTRSAEDTISCPNLLTISIVPASTIET